EQRAVGDRHGDVGAKAAAVDEAAVAAAEIDEPPAGGPVLDAHVLARHPAVVDLDRARIAARVASDQRAGAADLVDLDGRPPEHDPQIANCSAAARVPPESGVFLLLCRERVGHPLRTYLMCMPMCGAWAACLALGFGGEPILDVMTVDVAACREKLVGAPRDALLPRCCGLRRHRDALGSHRLADRFRAALFRHAWLM